MRTNGIQATFRQAAPVVYLKGDDLIREIPATAPGVILEEDEGTIRVRCNDRYGYGREDWRPRPAWTRRDWIASTRHRVGQR